MKQQKDQSMHLSHYFLTWTRNHHHATVSVSSLSCQLLCQPAWTEAFSSISPWGSSPVSASNSSTDCLSSQRNCGFSIHDHCFLRNYRRCDFPCTWHNRVESSCDNLVRSGLLISSCSWWDCHRVASVKNETSLWVLSHGYYSWTWQCRLFTARRRSIPIHHGQGFCRGRISPAWECLRLGMSACRRSRRFCFSRTCLFLHLQYLHRHRTRSNVRIDGISGSEDFDSGKLVSHAQLRIPCRYDSMRRTLSSACCISPCSGLLHRSFCTWFFCRSRGRSVTSSQLSSSTFLCPCHHRLLMHYSRSGRWRCQSGWLTGASSQQVDWEQRIDCPQRLSVLSLGYCQPREPCVEISTSTFVRTTCHLGRWSLGQGIVVCHGHLRPTMLCTSHASAASTYLPQFSSSLVLVTLLSCIQCGRISY